MAFALRFSRRSLVLYSSLLRYRPLSSSSSSFYLCRRALSATIFPNPSPDFNIQHRSFHSTTTAANRRWDIGEEDKIKPDEILFEGCDYNHWLITMDFPKDPKPSPEEMVETYVQTAAKVLGSVEEAKKKIYACSTTTYEGFQVEVSEETSEKFKGLPGVVFVLPDSYIDPVSKQYGGDKYDNGVITPRPPPIQYGRQGRYGDRNRNYDRPRFDRNRDSGPMQQGNQPYDRNYAPQQNYGPPGGQRDFGPPGQSYGPPGERRDFGPPGQSYSPPGERRDFGPPGQSYGPPGERRDPGQSYGPPGERRDPGQSYGPPGERRDPGQSYGPPGERRDPGQSYGPPGERRDPGQSYAPPGERRDPGQSYAPPGERRDPGQSYAPPGERRDVGPPGQSYGSPGERRDFGPPGQNYGPPGGRRDFGPPGQSYSPSGERPDFPQPGGSAPQVQMSLPGAGDDRQGSGPSYSGDHRQGPGTGYSPGYRQGSGPGYSGGYRQGSGPGYSGDYRQGSGPGYSGDQSQRSGPGYVRDFGQVSGGVGGDSAQGASGFGGDVRPGSVSSYGQN